MNEEFKKESDIIDLLNYVTPAGKSIKDLSTVEFCQFVLSKFDGKKMDSYDRVNLLKKINGYGLHSKISDESRIDIIIRLRNIGLWK